MKQIIFYSWQSDLPNATNRGFIQDALEGAAAAITSDSTVEIEPVVDRDTQGVPGSPDISSTIFSKITSADAFVADVSFIPKTEGRPTPNPNVLIELGYALRAIGHENVVLVFNRAFGEIEKLPFDLKTRRILSYEMPLNATPRGPERKALEKQLEAAIRAALQGRKREPEAPSIPALPAIEMQAPNRLIVLRRNLADIFQELDRLEPRTFSNGCTIEEFIEALVKTQETVAEFSKVVEIIALMSDVDAAKEVVRWFGNAFERYSLPQGFAGTYRTSDQDYFKFLGHEMMVTLVAFLLREQRWSIIEAILDEPIPVRFVFRTGGPGIESWRFASEHLPSLGDEGSRRGRVSLHADLLQERHSTGGLGVILSMEEFVAADFLLYLLGEVRESDRSNWGSAWRPWSALYMKSAPLFLANSERKKVAQELLKLCQLKSTEDLKQGITGCTSGLGKLFDRGWWLNPIRTELVEKIGTR